MNTKADDLNEFKEALYARFKAFCDDCELPKRCWDCKLSDFMEQL